LLNTLRHKCVAAIAAIAFAGTILTVGCGSSVHPGQLSPFDGAAYDTFTVAHAALQTLRSQVSSLHPQFKDTFNQAAVSYEAAYNSYVLFRNAPAQNQAQVAVEINNLTVSIIALENAFQAEMHADPKLVADTRAKARHIKARANANGFSISDILTELEIAATIAQAIPGASPYAAIASIVIQGTQAAVAALSAASGQAINLASIAPVALL
jgi:type IV secretory pathway VirJ component